MNKVTTLIVHAAAKLNLLFDVLGARTDGYHDIRTIFQSIDLEDTLVFRFTESDTDSFRVKLSLSPESASWVNSANSEGAVFPLQENNLIAKAAHKFAQSSGQGKGITLDVSVAKKIPISAGLAGGSSNAAATLAASNMYFGQPYTLSHLLELAAELGSDIPFCLEGGTCLGSGRGEKLQRLPGAAALNFLLVKPRTIAISTPWIYRAYDEHRRVNDVAEDRPPDFDEYFKTISGSDARIPSGLFRNAFEPVVFATHPEIAMLRDSMLRHGCLSANITGSGPTLFGLVPNRETGDGIRRMLIDEYAGRGKLGEFDCWLTRSVTHGVRISGDLGVTEDKLQRSNN